MFSKSKLLLVIYSSLINLNISSAQNSVDSNSTDSSVNMEKNQLGNYLIMMDDPYAEEENVYDEIFDKKITTKMKEKQFDNVKSEIEERKMRGLDVKRSDDLQKHDQEQGDFARWVSKKLIQHHVEKTMEQAPKGSALGMANSARVIVQNYKVEVTPGNEFTAGYDLPTNKAKIGFRGFYGEHSVHANFNEDDFGPGQIVELYLSESKKIHGTKFSSKYSFLDNLEIFRIEQDFFYEGLVLVYQYQQNLKTSSSNSEHFSGIAFNKQF